MCPMQDPTLVVPLVLTIEFHLVACPQSCNAGSQIDVVRNQQGVAAANIQNKPLMATAFIVIGENSDYRTGAGNLDIACALLERLLNLVARRRGQKMTLGEPDNEDDGDQECRRELLHLSPGRAFRKVKEHARRVPYVGD